MKALIVRLLAVAALTSICAAPASAQTANASAEAEVRAAVKGFNQAYEQNLLDEYFGYYGEDASLIFDIDRVDLADYKSQWYQLIAEGGGVLSNSLSDIQVVVDPSGDTAIATYLLEISTRQPDGSINKETASETDVWSNNDGSWQVIHINYSAKPAEQ